MRVVVVALGVLLTVLVVPAARADTCTNTADSDWTTTTVRVSCKAGATQAPGAGKTTAPPGRQAAAGSAGPATPEPTFDADGCIVYEDNSVCSPTGANLAPTLSLSVTPSAAPASPPVPEETIREATAQIVLPEPDVNVGPDPSVNKWNAVAVGYPLWLWTSGDKQVATTVEAQGIAISLEARRTHTVFEMGDGGKVRCKAMARYSKPVFWNDPPKESPNCGYRYQQLPKRVGAGYTVTVTTHWTVTWTAAGATGELTMTRTGSRHLNVVEIQSVIVAR